ncbi:MAG: (2Fe-2S)-binding protein, partial [Firmicutes bacterium]|nr:(2Fe-2S)-binding protein [Alicyclobacillaceae bacterium]MCL6498392.1 (2Fe-2S)-binding protein [Bacillota bacterium]
YRPAKPGQLYWRIAQFLFPFYTQPPEGVLGHHLITNAWVPMDDHHTLTFTMLPRPQTGPGVPGWSRQARLPIQGWSAKYPQVGLETLPNTSDWYGRFRLSTHPRNDHGLDRQLQRSGQSYTGIASLRAQDQAATESMGPIYDRTEEHLAVSDVMVIRVRRRLLQALDRYQKDGETPPGVDQPAVYRVRSGGVVLPEGADWIAATEALRTAVPASLNPSS